MSLLLTKRESALLDKFLNQKLSRTASFLKESMLIIAGSLLVILPLLFVAFNLPNVDRIVHVAGIYLVGMLVIGLLLLVYSYVLVHSTKAQKEIAELQTIFRKLSAEK